MIITNSFLFLKHFLLMYLYNRTFFKSDLRKTDEAVKLKVYVYKNILINFSRFLPHISKHFYHF